MIVRAVLCDLYCTLVDGGPQAERDEVSREMAVQLGLDPERFAEIFRATMRARMAGELGTLSETLRILAHRMGVVPAEGRIRLAEVTRMRYSRRRIWPSADTLRVLDALRRKRYLLGLVSNCSEETVTLWPQQPMSTRFDAVAFSCEIGLCKPDPGIFLKVCGDLGVVPKECLFLGDGESRELEAARDLGMRVVRTTQFADSFPEWIGEEIGHLDQLEAKIAGGGALS